jgi:hypothetical protein
MVEGEDFYIDGGNYVFTAAYLLKRGYCCEYGCRHCPYGVRADCQTVPEDDLSAVPV